MPAFEGGAAQPVTVDTTGGKRQAGAAIPVYVASGGPQIAGPARRVVPVLDGPIAGQAAVPIYVAEPGAVFADEPAMSVYVVSGLLDPLSALVYTNKTKALAPANLIAYWPQAEKIGTVAYDESGHDYHGTYNAVTLLQPGIGDGRTAASFDGSASYNNIYSAALDTALNKAEGTLSCWFQVASAGVWIDGAIRTLVSLRNGAGNLIELRKSSANNTFQAFYLVGGVNKNVAKASYSPTTYQHVAITWSKAADQFKLYVGGIQEGATQTGLGTWVGALSPVQTNIGCRTNMAFDQGWKGRIAHVALWNTPLSAAQIAALAVVL